MFKYLQVCDGCKSIFGVIGLFSKKRSTFFFLVNNNTNYMLGTLEFVGSELWAPFNFLTAHPWWTFAFIIIVGAPRQWSCRITRSSWKPYTTKGTSSAKQQAHSSSSWTRWVYDLTYKLFFLFILAVRAGPHTVYIAHYIPNTCKSEWSQACTHRTFFIGIWKLNSVKPPLYKWHPQGDGKWLLNGGWPLNRGSFFTTQGQTWGFGVPPAASSLTLILKTQYR